MSSLGRAQFEAPAEVLAALEIRGALNQHYLP